MSLKSQLGPNQDLNLLDLPDGKSDLSKTLLTCHKSSRPSQASYVFFCQARTADEEFTCILLLELNCSFSLLLKPE